MITNKINGYKWLQINSLYYILTYWPLFYFLCSFLYMHSCGEFFFIVVGKFFYSCKKKIFIIASQREVYICDKLSFFKSVPKRSQDLKKNIFLWWFFMIKNEEKNGFLIFLWGERCPKAIQNTLLYRYLWLYVTGFFSTVLREEKCVLFIIHMQS